MVGDGLMQNGSVEVRHVPEGSKKKDQKVLKSKHDGGRMGVSGDRQPDVRAATTNNGNEDGSLDVLVNEFNRATKGLRNFKDDTLRAKPFRPKDFRVACSTFPATGKLIRRKELQKDMRNTRSQQDRIERYVH
jgi:hypothetical protein